MLRDEVIRMNGLRGANVFRKGYRIQYRVIFMWGVLLANGGQVNLSRKNGPKHDSRFF